MSASAKAFTANLRKCMAEGKERKQCLAIAYRIQRDAKAKKK